MDSPPILAPTLVKTLLNKRQNRTRNILLPLPPHKIKFSSRLQYFTINAQMRALVLCNPIAQQHPGQHEILQRDLGVADER